MVRNTIVPMSYLTLTLNRAYKKKPVYLIFFKKRKECRYKISLV